MWYQVLIPSPLLIIPVLVMTTKCHTPKGNPDVIVISSKHAESIPDIPIKNDTAPLPLIQELDYNNIPQERTTIRTPLILKVTTPKQEEQETEIISSSEDIIFIPNQKEEEIKKEEIKEEIKVKEKRVEDYWKEQNEPPREEKIPFEKMSLKDFMNAPQEIHDFTNLTNIKMETENANEDVIFVTGKNNDFIEKPTEIPRKPKKHFKGDNHYRKHPDAIKNPKKLNCTYLDCNNNINSVCGGKLENRNWKYRLFLNECYFRKVNCYFKRRENRYQQVHLDHCENIGIHSLEPFEYKPYQPPPPLHEEPQPTNAKVVETRRSSSRRSLTMSIDGRLCSHACPTTCSEHYDPECAVSGTGRFRVFMNHCMMDWNSCSYGVVWHKRPLADCVGGKKADMRQNRGFINWMQSVGIVDNKGRLVLN